MFLMPGTAKGRHTADLDEIMQLEVDAIVALVA
jgi:hypothetical protein